MQRVNDHNFVTYTWWWTNMSFKCQITASFFDRWYLSHVIFKIKNINNIKTYFYSLRKYFFLFIFAWACIDKIWLIPKSVIFNFNLVTDILSLAVSRDYQTILFYTLYNWWLYFWTNIHKTFTLSQIKTNPTWLNYTSIDARIWSPIMAWIATCSYHRVTDQLVVLDCRLC